MALRNLGSADDHPEEQSLLEDASTLLGFSQGNSRAANTHKTQKSRKREVEINMSAIGDFSGISVSSSGTNVSVRNDAAGVEVAVPVKESREDNDLVGMNQIGAESKGQEARFGKPKGESDNELKKSWPIPDSYIVDPDDGIITCLCGYDCDDGFTIQCDHCYRWQHASCYGIEDESAAPDDFLCKACFPRNIDAKTIKRKQQEQMKANKRGRRSVQAEVRTSSAPQYTSINKTSVSGIVGCLGSTNPNFSRKDVDPVTRKYFMDAKDAYPAVYLPLENYDFKDKYTALFINSHSNDDWVIPYNKARFKALPIEVRAYSDTNNSRIFPGYSKLGVFIQQSCNKGAFIERFLGEVDFQKRYLEDPRNNYRLLGVPSPMVIFHPKWSIYIDARMSGNLTRCIRRSCYPNVEIVTIKLKSSISDEQKTNVCFVLRALHDIEKDEELLIKWDWDLRHPMWKVISGSSVDSIEESNRSALIHSVELISTMCDCGCKNNKDCNIVKVKKYTQTLYKSIKSKMNNIYKLTEILQTAKVQNRGQTSILSSLEHEAITNSARAHEVLLKFKSTRLSYLEAQEKLTSKKSCPSKYDTIFTNTAQLDSISNSVKPYRHRLIDRFNENTLFLKRKNDNVTGLIDPFKFNENGVSDLDKLAIPIEIKIPVVTPNTVSFENTSTPEPAEANVHTVEFNDEAAQRSVSFSNPVPTKTSVLNSSVIGNSSSSISPTSVINFAPSQNTKKKLSFADYKRKLKPT